MSPDSLDVLQGRPDRVVLAGIARSGTSWLVRAMARSEGTRHYYEPDNIDADPTGQRAPGGHGFLPYPIIEPGSDGEPYRPVWDAVLAGRLPQRKGLNLVVARTVMRLPPAIRSPLVRSASRALTALPGGPDRTVVKTIYAVLSLDWLTARYDPRVVVLQRHPYNVVASWRDSDPMFDLAARPDIRKHFVEPLGIEPPAAGASDVARIAWHVGLLTTALGDSLARHDGWMLIDHETLCEDPELHIHRVFTRLGLPWTAAVEQFLAENNRPGTGFQVSRVARDQPARWRARLTEAEIEDIEAVLSRFPRRGWVRVPPGI